jgi:serine/threonine-protein kinase
MGKQLREDPESPRVRAPRRGIPEALDRVILRALAKGPCDRFASAAAMREALESAIAAPARSRARTKRLALAVALGGTLGISSALAYTGGWIHPILSATPAMAEVAQAAPLDLAGGVPLPVPPTAAPTPTPPAAPMVEALPAPLPPLPAARALSSPSDMKHPRKLHSHLPGMETVSHKTTGRAPGPGPIGH